MKAAGFTVLLFCSLISCYSFKGISIAPEIKSFQISPVEDLFFKAPAGYPVEFSEALLSKIRKESRLVLDNRNPDLVFQCRITQFEVNSQAPQPGILSAINRCTITIEVEMSNKKDEKQNWKSSFTRFQDFDAKENFSNIQQEITSEINKLLVDDIFNRSFTNW